MNQIDTVIIDDAVDGQHEKGYSFPKFPQLAVELRALVWDYALPSGTVAVTWDQETEHITLRRLKSAESTSMQLACTEARTAWLHRHRHVRLIQPPQKTEPGPDQGLYTARMDLVRDLLYFGQGPPAAQSIAAFSNALAAGQLIIDDQGNPGTFTLTDARRPRLQHVRQIALSLTANTSSPEFFAELARFPALRTLIAVWPLSYGHEQHGPAAATDGDVDGVLADATLLNMAAHLARADREGSEECAALVAAMVCGQPGAVVPAPVRRFFGESPRPQIKFVQQQAGRRTGRESSATLGEWRERCVEQMY